jgi:hypothetical protein
MEQAPADARAAPIAAGPANMDTTESLSPKRPRESASGKMVSQRATQNHPGEPENRSSAHEAACQRTTSTSQSLAHHASLMGGRLKSEVDRAPPQVEHLVHSTIFNPAERQRIGRNQLPYTLQHPTTRAGPNNRVTHEHSLGCLIKTHTILTLQSKTRVTPGLTQKRPTGKQAVTRTENTQMTRTPTQGSRGGDEGISPTPPSCHPFAGGQEQPSPSASSNSGGRRGRQPQLCL